MGEERGAVVFTDPPCNVPIDVHASGLGAIHHRPFPMASGEMDGAEFTAFLRDAFANLAAFSVDGALHFVCMDWRHLDELLAAGHATYGELKNLCVWIKDNGRMGALYRSQHEQRKHHFGCYPDPDTWNKFRQLIERYRIDNTELVSYLAERFITK